MSFDTIIVVDWSARSTPSPARPSADAIWIAVLRDGGTAEISYHRTRAAATDALGAIFDAELAAGRRVLAGFDFPFGYPRGFARAVTGTDDPLALWRDLAKRIADGPDNANNRWKVARDLNRLFPGIGPFWGCPSAEAGPDLPARGSERSGHGLPERRAVEQRLRRAQPCWKLYTTGSVGSQALLGIPRLQALRERFGPALSVSPFESPEASIVLSEVFPSLIDAEVRRRQAPDEIRDRAQVRVLAEALARVPGPDLLDWLREGDPEEGWILGLGHEGQLVGDPLRPPPLWNDCFALPQGVDWTPVNDALAHLRRRMRPVTATVEVPLSRAAGRVLAAPLLARQSHPPAANSAVDGYGFARASVGDGPAELPLVDGRAAAGHPLNRPVPPGHAVRILTGAALPEGVDTVVLEEDCATDGRRVAFSCAPRAGANTRPAGEDVGAGAEALPAGRRLTPADLALATATGHGTLTVREKLRVGILSTGDELAEPGSAEGGRIGDANRPMLIAMVRAWGHEPVDLGIAPDDAGAVRAALDRGAAEAHAVLTSGGASAGDEDHLSRILRTDGALSLWRVAVKPGRPLALGVWQGAPVFGLPGNPVAAFVCAAIFARPALAALAGEDWPQPLALTVPAAFAKRKKPGRREFLRARLRDGRAEVFASEGSGRISGLSWAEGLVDLPEEAATISPGDPVRYLPFAGLGLA